MTSRTYPSGYRPTYPPEPPEVIARGNEPLPEVPLKPRWPYVVATLAVLVFLIAIGFFLTDAANDVIEDFSRYLTAEPVDVPAID